MDDVTGGSQESEAAGDTSNGVNPSAAFQSIEQPKLKAPEPTKDEDAANPREPNLVKRIWQWCVLKEEKTGLHDWFIVLFTFVLTLVAVFQGVIVFQNSKSGTAQMGKVIDAANRIDDAADSFATSSADISRGVQDAVGRLSKQAVIADEARQSSQDASSKSLKASIETSRTDQRAWVGTSDSTQTLNATEPVSAAVTVTNVGRSPAIRVVARIDRFYQKKEFSPRGEDFSLALKASPFAFGTLFPNQRFPLTTYNFPPVQDSQKALIGLLTTGDLVMYVFGNITYDDVFLRHHWINFCYSVDKTLPSLTPARRSPIPIRNPRLVLAISHSSSPKKTIKHTCLRIG